jgi:hypothetical protein
MFLRTLKVLNDLQSAVASQPPEPPSQLAEPSSGTSLSEPPFPTSPQPLTSPIGFVPPNSHASHKQPHLTQMPLLTPPGNSSLGVSVPRR